MTEPGFIHLRAHSEYSLVDGIVRIKPLIERAKEFGMPAVGLTDHSNLFGMVKFYRATLARGIKPIIGADLLLRNPKTPAAPSKITLLCQDDSGYLALTELLSRAYLEGQHQGVPTVSWDWVKAHNQGLIALSGGLCGEIGQFLLGSRPEDAAATLEKWLEIFEHRFYLELQRTARPNEEYYIARAIELALKFDTPVVATNDVRFLDREDFRAHEARVCIYQGRVLDDPRRPMEYSEWQYFRCQEEMVELFSDIPEALSNSVEIARRCNLSLSLGKNYLPEFPVPDNTPIADYFIALSRQGLSRRLAVHAPIGTGTEAENRTVYEDRLQRELDVILQMGFPGYFLIVADFIRWAKENGIPVGPGRGSGAGSLVAYALGITDLDPLEFDLLFERFLNPERVSMPDFDIDFCMEGRDRVIEYVADKYGRERVSQIITYGSMAARAVVRDVGRVLGYSYGFVDSLAKLIPFELGMTLDKALTDSEELDQKYQSEEETRELIDLAKSLEGIARNAGKHAGGVVIAPSRLTDFAPLYCEQGGANLVTQFDKDDVESVGLVKFDFLGLRTLTIIDWAVRAINAKTAAEGREPIDIARIPRDDPASYRLLKDCATTAVFQLESRGMKELIRRLKPDCFEDIIALVALFRPGPLQSGMVDDYIDVKHARRAAEYAHPWLEPILKPTNGVILYQEQVMEIARVLAGYTLGGADLLRRAMGKKKPEEMAKQREIFTRGAIKNQVDESTATYIFDLMEKFAGYGFNKSHSAAYALVAYQTAWLKAHYPAAFMAAVLSADMDNTDKIVILIEECRAMKLKILPPDVNQSEYRFASRGDATILYGLGAIKGVGEGAIDVIVRERNGKGRFADLVDFCERLDLNKVNKRVLEALIRSGAMDSLGQSRADQLRRLPSAMKTAEQQGRMQQSGQGDLFGLASIRTCEVLEKSDDDPDGQWSESRLLSEEKATLGLYLSGHPITRYERELIAFTSARIGALRSEPDRWTSLAQVRIAGLVVELRTRDSKRGKKMAFLTLDDRTGRIEVAVFSEAYDSFREVLSKDAILVAEGPLSIDDFSGAPRLTVANLWSLEQAREAFARNLQIRWHPEDASSGKKKDANFLDHLKQTISPFRGGNCPICIEYVSEQAKTRVLLGDPWKVRPAEELLNRLEHRLGQGCVQLNYS
ncbi:MAG: DNA polymerase III subunit alpha [Gammaproteobacteria bacterium]